MRGVRPLPGRARAGDARLQPLVGGVRRTLNIRLVQKIVSEAGSVPRLDDLQRSYRKLLEKQPPLPVYDRRPMTDAQVRAYKDYGDAYREILEERPWKKCPCDICKRIGIHVMLFRGAERNRRRGFHNVRVLYRRLRRELARV